MATDSFPWVDGLLHGQLEQLLRKWRGEGKSTRDIADEINGRLPGPASITHTTVHRYCTDLEIPKAAKVG